MDFRYHDTLGGGKTAFSCARSRRESAIYRRKIIWNELENPTRRSKTLSVYSFLPPQRSRCLLSQGWEEPQSRNYKFESLMQTPAGIFVMDEKTNEDSASGSWRSPAQLSQPKGSIVSQAVGQCLMYLGAKTSRRVGLG